MKGIGMVGLLLALNSGLVFAWGQPGHQLICHVAEQQLEMSTRQWLTKTLALGEYLDGNSSDNFAEACLWADTAKYSSHRDSYELHFINLPAGAKEINLKRDCPAMDCLPIGIRRSLVYLVQESHGQREDARKAAALRYLGYLIGELHQPLHVSHGEDRGGNNLQIRGFTETTNLHRIWDVLLVNEAGLSYSGSVKRLQRVGSLSDSIQTLDWLNNSYQLARKTAYQHANGESIISGDVLEPEYIQRALPLVEQQLAQAARHLANLLNQVASGHLTVNNLDERVFKP